MWFQHAIQPLEPSSANNVIGNHTLGSAPSSFAALARLHAGPHNHAMAQDLIERSLQQHPLLRLSTFIRIRWLAVAGQSAALLLVGSALGFQLPAVACAALVAASTVLNLYLSLRYPATQRLDPNGVFMVLLFDVLQLSGLLYLTGGLSNPFALLILVPVVISATVLSILLTVALGFLAVGLTTLLAFFYLPLPWYPGTELTLPLVYLAGNWVAIVSSLAFTAIYAWRVAREARQLAEALTATELVLQREQHLTDIDGLAAAAAHELGTPLATIALVAKEMSNALVADERFRDDLALLNTQVARCRDILKRLSTLEPDNRDYFGRLPLSALIEDVVAPHREFGVAIETVAGSRTGTEPVTVRNPGVLYGLGNVIENAVDFARGTVRIVSGWTAEAVEIAIADDGKGFPADVIDHLGEPYASGSRPRERESGGGLGLGLFIAKTLLARSGATVSFRNGAAPGQGAVVTIRWPRAVFEAKSSA